MTVAECAAWMGMSSDYVVKLIDQGYLEVERFGVPGQRQNIRVHPDRFAECLRSIGFRRQPTGAPQ